MNFCKHILFVVFVGLGIPVFGQYSSYWSESFSTKSALLSGAVVGGYQDESSIYYNPSILSDSSVNQFAFANGLAKLEYVRYENAMGTGLNIDQLESSVDPGFVSVNLYPKRKFGLVWKVALFNRTKYDLGYNGEHKFNRDLFPNVPGTESYLGRVENRMEYTDYWYGLGLAKFLSNRFSVGLSVFARYTGIRYRDAKWISVTSLGDSIGSDIVLSNSNQYNLRGYTWRGTFKIGANYRVSEELKVGMVVTTPSFNIIDNGSATRTESYLNVPDPDREDFLPDYVYDVSAENLEVRVRDPLSIAVGVDYFRKNYRWNFTAEWFAGLQPYKMVDQTGSDFQETFSNTVIPQADYLSMAGGGRSIVNFAVGMEKFQDNNQSWLFGFKTDFNALNNYDYEDLSHLQTFNTPKVNSYHFSAGKSFIFLQFDVLFGLRYTIARAQGLQEFANFNGDIFSDPQNPYSLEGPVQNNMNYAEDSFVVFVGLTLKNGR